MKNKKTSIQKNGRNSMKKLSTKTKKIICIVSILLAMLFIGALWLVTVKVYDENFNHRFETYKPLAFEPEHFENLTRTKYTFESNKKQKLTGYMYSTIEKTSPHAILVLAHGIGAGHNSYMDAINYFVQNGFAVFAYDATGCDESEGRGVGGLPQGVIDLEHAISFVKNSGNFSNFSNLPIVLFGHSWGAYSVCTVLALHPDVKAVVACSGFNRSSDLLEDHGKSMVGGAIYALLPFVRLYERMQCGKYASRTAMQAFEKSNASVMVVHSEDDKVVGIQCGFDIYKNVYENDERFKFLQFSDKGHNYFNVKGGYEEEINAQFAEFVATLDYDYNATENSLRFAEDKAQFINQNIDRKKWASRLDKELFSQFVAFYNERIGGID